MRGMKDPTKFIKTLGTSTGAITKLVDVGLLTVRKKRGFPTIELTKEGEALVESLKHKQQIETEEDQQ